MIDWFMDFYHTEKYLSLSSDQVPSERGIRCAGRRDRVAATRPVPADERGLREGCGRSRSEHGGGRRAATFGEARRDAYGRRCHGLRRLLHHSAHRSARSPGSRRQGPRRCGSPRQTARSHCERSTSSAIADRTGACHEPGARASRRGRSRAVLEIATSTRRRGRSHKLTSSRT